MVSRLRGNNLNFMNLKVEYILFKLRVGTNRRGGGTVFGRELVALKPLTLFELPRNHLIFWRTVSYFVGKASILTN